MGLIHVFDSLRYMATSWHGNAFLITDPFWGEPTSHWRRMFCFAGLNYQHMGKLICRSYNKTKQITKSVHYVWDVFYAPQDIDNFVLFYFVCHMYNFERDLVIYLSVFVAAIWMSPIFILMREVNLVKLVVRIVWLVVPSSGIMDNLSCWGLAELSQISWAPNLTRVGRNPVGTMSQKDSMLFEIFP